MKKAAIIIVNWNGLKFLKNCLRSVYKQTYKNFDVYFVDNGSIDESVNFVKNNFAKAKIIQLDKNYGFAKGNNEGIKEAFKDKKVEYIVCLNNDTIVDKNWLKELVKTAEKDNNIGSVQSKILLDSGKKIHSAGMDYYPDLQGDKEGGLSKGFGENSNKYNSEEKIFAGCGASIIYKRKVLDRVGLFDEDFFAYVEDLDLGWRIKNNGFVNYYCPDSKLIHFHSQTGIAKSPFKAFHIKRNIYFTAIKNMDLIGLFLFPFRDFAWNIKQIIKKDKGQKIESVSTNLIYVLIKAYIMVLIYSPKMLIKRFKEKKE